MADTFCPYLWRQYYLNPWKNQVCCLSGTVEGDVFDANTPDKKRIRLQMLAGERPPECKFCHDVEDKGGSSLRQDALKVSPLTEKAARTSTEPSGATWIQPDILDIRASSLCNFACLMCVPEISSRWIADKDILEPFHSEGELAHVRLNTIDEGVFGQIPQKMSEMAAYNDWLVVHMAGGEPLMDKRVLAVLDHLIETKVARRTSLILTTNGHFIDETMVARFQKFGFVCISVSLDGIGAVNDYIRHGSDFGLIDRNIRLLEAGGINYRNAFSVSALSVPYFEQFAMWARGEVYVQWVESPRYMRVNCLPQEVIDRTRERYEGRPGHFQTIANYLGNVKSDPALTEDFKLFLARNDAKRGVDHRKVFPEICEVLYT